MQNRTGREKETNGPAEDSTLHETAPLWPKATVKELLATLTKTIVIMLLLVLSSEMIPRPFAYFGTALKIFALNAPSFGARVIIAGITTFIFALVVVLIGLPRRHRRFRLLIAALVLLILSSAVLVWKSRVLDGTRSCRLETECIRKYPVVIDNTISSEGICMNIESVPPRVRLGNVRRIVKKPILPEMPDCMCYQDRCVDFNEAFGAVSDTESEPRHMRILREMLEKAKGWGL